MSQRKYFGTDGVRGKVGEGKITPAFAMKLGYAAGKVLSKVGTKKVIIGKDTRISGYMLESALEAGLSAAGIDTAFLGPMPTPAVAYLTRTFRAEAGIVISASHNPYYDNGIKFFSADGTKLDDDLELAIEAELDKDMGCVESEFLGRATRIEDAAGRYIEFCKSNFPNALSLHGLKLVVDCAHGATYHIAPAVFSELGAEVISIGCQPNGLNINDGYGATDLANLQKEVVAQQADMGIALDGDGDRLMMVDHEGRALDGDETLYIIVREALKSGNLQGGVVGTKMSNLGFELALRDLGIPFVRADVGDRYVLEQLVANNWKIGGENSGHIISLDHNTTGDGIVAALLILTAVLKSNLKLQDLCQGMTLMPQVMINVRFKGDNNPLENEQVKQAVVDAEATLGDRGRVLLRKSGTEPLIRVMVEGADATEVGEHATTISEVVKTVCG
ncbi:phosphoglucosamine mutase [Psychrobium sp. 1_MG-2023]|uniref:phosphoglucosamine mutase n=1 Tax=Psychrobium sp. 1_MG-2023 TaxID=3062624 RepID=UPI000C31E191|nr:phosphoglucosamine mutase [Psychrobium sp. 1_MG-2023]MDP2562678.1 phosphoglucosamine mutase [Psychrobium sp. 1_MG-2023]PKF54808.1 phosphoglucosamine mutase [Alteromonadales bacterium alter-6D02]